MLKLVKGVQPYVKPKPKVEVPRADNFVFRLHYRVTFSILALSSVLVTSYNYIDRKGSAIQCMINKGQPKAVEPIVQKWCWIMSTFTLPKYYEGNPGKDVVYHGVGPIEDGDETVYHAYYQWVPLMLMFQAICFYAPHWIWKQLDNGRMKNIIVGLNRHLEDDIKKNQKLDQLANYLKERREYKREHNSWARNFFLCECLNLFNVIIQIFLTDRFLGYEFSTYGIEVLQFSGMDQENRIDPMSKVFPRITKCSFLKYGTSGTIQNLDALCVLGMNILSEKIYVLLWFWFVILTFVTVINLIYSAFQLCSPTIRDRILLLESSGYVDRQIVKAQSKKKTTYAHVRREDIKEVVSKLSYPDWLVLFYLAQSMEKGNFGELLARLASDIRMENDND